MFKKIPTVGPNSWQIVCAYVNLCVCIWLNDILLFFRIAITRVTLIFNCWGGGGVGGGWQFQTNSSQYNSPQKTKRNKFFDKTCSHSLMKCGNWFKCYEISIQFWLKWKWSLARTHREWKIPSNTHLIRSVCRPLIIIYTIQSVDATAFPHGNRDRASIVLVFQIANRAFWPAATAFAFPLNRISAYIICILGVYNAHKPSTIPFIRLYVYKYGFFCVCLFVAVLRQLDHLKCRLVSLID